MSQQTLIRVRCCVCRRERTAAGWRSVPDDPEAVYSHTYCPICYAVAMAEEAYATTIFFAPAVARAASGLAPAADAKKKQERMGTMKTAATVIALALAMSTLNALAQDAGGPPAAGGGPSAGPGRPPRGLHLLPPHAEEQLNLTADQRQQLAALEAEVKAKLEKILTAEQMEQLKQMRPPPRQGGKGSKGGDGPTDRGVGGEDRPEGDPPPGE